NLPNEWEDISDQEPAGFLTVRWENPNATGVLKVSVAEYQEGPEPRPNKARLIDMAVSFGQEHGFGRPQNSSAGKCAFGLFGTATFKRAPFWKFNVPAYSYLWFLSNGLDFIFVTFFAKRKPMEREIGDAQKIVMAMGFS